MDNWKIEGPPYNHVRINGLTPLVPDLFKKLGCPDWNKRYSWLKKLGYKSVISNKGFSPVFNDTNELKQFVNWAKAKLATELKEPDGTLKADDSVNLNGTEWIVMRGYFLYSDNKSHIADCCKLLDELNSVCNTDYESLFVFAVKHGFTHVTPATFPIFKTLEELTRFYNYCKLQLNEVHRVTETDRDRDQGRAAYSPGKAKLISLATRRSGDRISVGRSKGRIATAKKEFSAACL